MAQMTLRDLRNAFFDAQQAGVPLDTPVVFQGNEPGEYNFCAVEGVPVDEEPSHTFCTGYVYNAFHNGTEFVIDCAVTDQE